MRLMAYTPCFRREAGSAGRDTRGLLRVHEFDKVEILAYTTPDQAQAMHAELLERAERSISCLGLAYRVLDLCTGDLGNSSARTFDIEVYAPGCDQWLEVSSVSWFSDYQARRANVRYKPGGGRRHASRAHAERLGARRAARLGRGRGDLSAARRHRSRSPKCCGRTRAGCHARSPARVPAVTTAQWIFAIALALVTVLITWLSVYVAWTTVWANRWYRRRG